MKKFCTLLVGSLAVSALCSFGQINSAYAYPKFLKAFQQKYVGDAKSGQTDQQKMLATEMKRVKNCNVCHDPRPDDSGKASKKNRNPYGQSLNKFLKEEDKNDVGKAVEMLSKIEGEKQDQDAETTYGDLIKAGKVPYEYKDFQAGDEEDDDSK